MGRMRVIDIEILDDQAARLERFAASVYKTPREASAQLIEEGLRHAEFPEVEFRDSASGRHSYVAGSTLAVWEVAPVAASYGYDPKRTSDHLRWPLSRVERILAYAGSYPDEIARALEANRSVSEVNLRQRLPDARWA